MQQQVFGILHRSAPVQLAQSDVWKTFATLAVMVSIGSCADDPLADPPIAAQVRLLSSATQSGTPGWPLSDSVVVEVLDAAGNPVSGVRVIWSAANGGDKLGLSGDATNAAGRVAAEWSLGANEGEQSL